MTQDQREKVAKAVGTLWALSCDGSSVSEAAASAAELLEEMLDEDKKGKQNE